jgi:hypothetical protein
MRSATAVIERPVKDWRMIATESDRARLRDWRTAFADGLAAARAAGHRDEIAREGALLQTDAALGEANPERQLSMPEIKVTKSRR